MRDRISAVLKKLVPEDLVIAVSAPEKAGQGDYATNVAFELGKLRGKPPMAVAQELAAGAFEAAPDFLLRVEASKPGFVNFWIKPEVLKAELGNILKAGKMYGVSQTAVPQKVQVEFISANPTGPLTLANGRGGFLGDVIANVLEAVGHVVEREYYVNDTGNQIATLGKSLLAARGFIPDEETFYKGNYIKVWADAHAKIVEKHQGDPQELGSVAAKDFLEAIKGVVEGKADILFSRYTSERDDIRAKRYPEKALALFRSKKVVYEKDGATWLRTTEFGDDKDRVLLTSAGGPTYLLADAGHYLETVERGFDRKVNILGPDHYGYVARIQAAAKLVGLKDSTVLITQAVRLMEGNTEVKMSKRRGTFVTFDELVEETGPDAARFFFLMIAPESHLDFDLALAKERSVKNPVYYVQYGFVRATNIIEKAGGPSAGHPDLSSLSTPEDLRLIRKMVQFPEVLQDIAADYRVHRLTRYATELASAFHDWYEKERVVGEEHSIAQARLALVSGTKVVFGNLLRTLGIHAPEKM